MDAIDRRSALRSLLCGAVATGLGVGLLPGSAAAMPLAMEKISEARPTISSRKLKPGPGDRRDGRSNIRVAIITGTVAIGTVVIGTVGTAVGFTGGIEAVACAAGGEHPSAVRQGQSVIWRIP